MHEDAGGGKRTTPEGVDFIIDQITDDNEGEFTIIVQELPESPESFIHMDMAFTMLSKEHCMVYAPLFLLCCAVWMLFAKCCDVYSCLFSCF